MPRRRHTQVFRPAESQSPDPRADSRRARLLPLIVCFTLGALALLQLPELPDPRWLLSGLIPVLWPSRYRWYFAAALLGFALADWRAQALLAQRWPISRLGEEIAVKGTVASLPQSSTDRGGEEAGEGAKETRTWRFIFEPDDPVLPPRIRVSWYRSEEQLRGADCWTLTLRLRPPHGSLNPGGFDYEGWLFRQGIGATATVRAGEPCGKAPGHALLQMRQRLADRFASWLPGHPGLPLVSALAIGDTSALDDEDWQSFRVTGTTHLIAISGFNVAIIAGLAFFLLRWAWSISSALCLLLPAQRAGLLGSALAALIYALLAGFDPPVERAALMLLFLLAAGWFGGFAQPSRALAVAWSIIVINDPLALMTPGLWLSFGAVAAIYYISTGRLGAQPGWRAALQVQWMLSVVLAPLTLFWFQGTSLLGPLVNLLAVPVAALLTPALLAALMLAAVVPSLGVPALRLIATVLDQSARGLGWLAAQLPQAWVSASPEPAVLALALIGSLILFAPTGLPLRLLGGLCFAALLLPTGSTPRAGDFELAALDVGQGLAVVIRTEQHTLLFDAGPAFPDGFDAGRSVVAPYLLKIGARRLDKLIVSHSDLDHRGGVPAVRELIRVDQEIGALVPDACRVGDTWDWDGVRFELLNGPAPGLSTNDGGCVLRIVGAHLSALLPADIEAASEARLLASGSDLHADVLLAPHHGSKTSSSPAFIDAVQPKIVIHSAGWHHRFGHPAPLIVARYAERLPEVRQYSTGDSGAVLVRYREGAEQVSEWREVDGRLWSTPADRAWLGPKP